jgi:hypothetical protein
VVPGDEKLTPADPADVADTLAFSLLFDGRKRKHDAGEFMEKIVAERLVRHLEGEDFVIMTLPLVVGAAALRTRRWRAADGVMK